MPEAGTSSSLEPRCSALGPARQTGTCTRALRVALVTSGEDTGGRGRGRDQRWDRQRKARKGGQQCVCAHTLTGMYTHTLSSTHTCVCTDMHSHRDIITHTHVCMHILTCTHMDVLSQTHVCTQTPSGAHLHAHSHRHTLAGSRMDLCTGSQSHMRVSTETPS